MIEDYIIYFIIKQEITITFSVLRVESTISIDTRKKTCIFLFFNQTSWSCLYFARVFTICKQLNISKQEPHIIFNKIGQKLNIKIHVFFINNFQRKHFFSKQQHVQIFALQVFLIYRSIYGERIQVQMYDLAFRPMQQKQHAAPLNSRFLQLVLQLEKKGTQIR